jgi:hypothetical protein
MPRFELFSGLSRISHGDNTPRWQVGQISHPGDSYTSFERDLVNRLIGAAKMERGIHMGA